MVLDQYYFVHSNGLVLIGIWETHDLIVNQYKISKIVFDLWAERRHLERDWKVTGKKKHGASHLQEKSVICEIRCENGKNYKIRS